MNYPEFEAFVLNLPRASAIKSPKQTTLKPNYEVVKKALTYLGVDISSLKIIHVAGTNGKGSVGVKIATSLAASGYSTGLFSSPHLLCIRERISILTAEANPHNKQIPAEDFLAFGVRVLSFHEKHTLTCSFFDFLTILAFLWFYEKKVDVIVCETGIGGRFDSTNFFNPILSVITSISFDHQELLGQSLEEIAWHKAGVIKQGVPVVIGPNVKQESIFAEARQLSCQIYKPKLFSKDYEIDNRLTASEALKCLSSTFLLTKKAIDFGLEQVPLGRYQKLIDTNHQLWILDVGHNQEGVFCYLERIQKEFNFKNFVIVFSIAKDKAYEAMLPSLASCAETIFLAQPENPRLEDPRVLQKLFLQLGFKNTRIINLAKDLAQIQLASYNKKRPILALGSFLLIAQILKNLR